jgi:hypothetical protein
MKRTPFTTRSGVKIGLMYEPPKRYETSNDMDRLQTALLGEHIGLRQLLREWRDYLLLLAAIFAALLVASCTGAWQ